MVKSTMGFLALNKDSYRFYVIVQWRIQDFPEEGAPTPRGGEPTYDLAKFSQENCMKLKEFGPLGGHASLAPPLDPPL